MKTDLMKFDLIQLVDDNDKVIIEFKIDAYMEIKLRDGYKILKLHKDEKDNIMKFKTK